MSKKDSVISEETKQVRGEMSAGAMIATVVATGPIGVLAVLAFGEPKFETVIRDDNNNLYRGTGATADESRGAAYAKMK